MATVEETNAVIQYEDGRVVLRGPALAIHAATLDGDQPGPG
jgi:hypothetical protein